MLYTLSQIIPVSDRSQDHSHCFQGFYAVEMRGGYREYVTWGKTWGNMTGKS